MPAPLPALSLAAVPGRRARTLELAREIEDRGFSGIWCPSFGDCVGLCLAMAQVTNRVTLATSIQPIYFRVASDLAATASLTHELSGGRFLLGIGVSHGPVHQRLGLSVGKPLSDIRAYVAAMRKAEAQVGPLPPIVLATLRTKMVELALEVADGAVWANASRSDMGRATAPVPAERRSGDKAFVLADMVPTVIDDDEAAAAAVCRKTLTGYVALPNYRNYWKSAGYVEEMEAIEAAQAAGQHDRVPGLMSDKWLSDATLYGSAAKVRAGVEAWFDAGVTPIVVPSSTRGGQLVAMQEVFDAFAS